MPRFQQRAAPSNPLAVCAAAGRKKYGAKKFAAMAQGGGRGASGAAQGQPFRRSRGDVYEEFHGRPSEEVVTVTEKIHYHEHLAALGELRTLVVQARDGGKVTLSRFKKAILCCNEAKTQMFIRGGDQAVDLEAFGIRTVHEVETLGRVVELAYFTTERPPRRRRRYGGLLPRLRRDE